MILDPHGEVVGVGQTEPAGGRHAGWSRCVCRESVPEGTAVVTLEPCNHHGRTPPCVDALLEARRRIRRLRGA